MNNKTELQKHEGAEGTRKPLRADKNKGGGDGRKRWLLLAVDLFLLAMIVAAAVLIIVALNSSDDTDGASTELRSVTYQLEFVGVDAELFSVVGGESAVDVATGHTIGIVEYHDGGHICTKYIDSAEEMDGKYFVESVEYPEDVKTFVVTLRADADYEAGVGYTVNGCRLAVGREYTLRFSGYTGTAVCVSLQHNAG